MMAAPLMMTRIGLSPTRHGPARGPGLAKLARARARAAGAGPPGIMSHDIGPAGSQSHAAALLPSRWPVGPLPGRRRPG
jgi:hypothetical protein